MTRSRKLNLSVFGPIGFAAGLLLMSGLLAATDGDATATKLSQFAPAPDLGFELKALVAQIHKALADPADYEDAAQGRVAKDANTIAVLAMVLAHHDQPNPYQKSAALVVQRALELADASGNYAAAHAAMEKLDQALAASSGGPVAWKAIGNSEQLMLQVPRLNTSLRRAINGRRFARSRDKAAALSATLAALAQVSMMDHSYCSTAADRTKWEAYCAAMRDAAAKCNQAVHANDPVAAKKMLNQMMQSCDDCHEAFRD